MIPLATKAGPAPSPFSPEQQKRFDAGLEKAVAKYPRERRKAALIAALHLVQDELGWLPEPAMAYVGDLLEVPPVRVREVATFYTMYRLRPVGRHHIGVCNSISCWAMGSTSVLRRCEEKLGIRPGETTRDGQFSLEEVACLAACGGAPALLVNNFTYLEKVTAESLDQLLADLGSQPGKQMAPAGAGSTETER
ncbi:MAG: NADH-quinone oxidoreductase subunit NuoE [Deltaproteobacteria bacterium]|nr:MAG: NADH-quinone oxidoreductase subunit NuoE [Deltaproteobacteria bacterium]